jgi:hypothetical protein
MRSMPSYAKDATIAVAPDSEADAMDLKDIVAHAKVSRQTAQRALDELVQAGMLCRTGKGKRGDACRYSLPGIVSFQLLTQRVSLEKKRIEQMGEISLKLITNLGRCRLRLFCGCFDDLHVLPFSLAGCNETLPYNSGSGTRLDESRAARD